VRLARTLAKAAVILAVVVVALGGAAALGSTLFEWPPRDAAEFAARVEAGSTHAPPAERRTAAERRYLLRLNELCTRTNEEYADLERRTATLEPAAAFRSWQKVFARFDRRFQSLEPPKRYRADAARIAALGRGMLDLAEGALDARSRGDRETYDTKREAAELLDDRFDETMLRLDAAACATD